MIHDRTDSMFAGSVPDLYEQYLVPLIFQVYADDLADRVAALTPTAVLELAGGTGVATRSLATQLDSSIRITASDLNPAMIHTAVRRGTARPVEWCAADALELPFRDDSFDAVVCQFGAMFFPDRIGAYVEVRRVLRRSGVVVFNVWDEIASNDFAATVTDAVAEVYLDDPPRFMARTPHGYHDEAVIREDLIAAGFATPVSIERLEHRSVASTADDVARAFCSGTPLLHELERRDPALVDAATAHAARRLTERFGPADLDGRMAAIVVTATTGDHSPAE